MTKAGYERERDAPEEFQVHSRNSINTWGLEE